MGVRLTDAELLKFLATVRALDADPHQDYGDVGFVFEELDEHLLLEELIAARKVVAAVRSLDTTGSDEWETVVAYDKLFAERDNQIDRDEVDKHSYCPIKSE